MLHEQVLSARPVAAPATADNASPVIADLVGLKLNFNLFPAQYVHASWLAHLGLHAGESPEIARSPLWVRTLSIALLRRRQLHRHFDCDFHDPAKRLALIDAATLTRIGGLVLATLLRERLRRIVQGPRVLAVHDCMGAEARQFALRWRGPTPAIPTPFDGSERWINSDSWTQRSIALLFAVVPAHAIGVVERMRLRFPMQWTLPDPEQSRLNEGQRGALMALIVAVIADVAPGWSWLFAAEGTRVAPSARGDVGGDA